MPVFKIMSDTSAPLRWPCAAPASGFLMRDVEVHHPGIPAIWVYSAILPLRFGTVSLAVGVGIWQAVSFGINIIVIYYL